MQWTPAAMQALEDYLAKVKAASAKGGADPEEVAEDIRSHMEETLQRKGHSFVTVDDVRRATVLIGVPGTEDRSLLAEIKDWANPGLRWWPLALGVALPLAAILGCVMAENNASFYASLLPSLPFVGLALLTPAAVAGAWWLERRPGRRPPLWLQVLVGGGTAIAAIYTWILGLAPFSFIGPVFPLNNWGRLLLLTPILALFAVGKGWKTLGRRGANALWFGALAALGIFVALEAPRAWTRLALGYAAGGTGSDARGLSMLRFYAQEETMREATYSMRSSHPTDILGRMLVFRPVDHMTARRIYYRVFGSVFSAQPAPDDLPVPGTRGRKFFAPNRGIWEQGGETVGGRIQGLSLHSSHFDAKPSPDAMVAYTEWTLEFNNAGTSPQEARAQIALPPGGVVSRLTLWVNGVEREAVFHETGKVRAAYQRIVSFRRDPVLVTVAGADRIMFQCFPVPAGGRLKARVGITAPMAAAGRSEALLYGPFFLERNFDLNPEFSHTLWSSQGNLVRTLPDSQLSSGQLWAAFPRDPNAHTAWTVDPANPGRYVVQKLFWETEKKDYVVVLDASVSMAPYRDSLLSLFEALPADAKVIVAADRPAPAVPVSDLIRDWRRLKFVGGQDNMPGLLAGFQGANARVLWIHGPQAVELSPVEPLRRILERGENSDLLSCQIANGPNRIFESLGGLANVRTLRPRDGADKDIPRLFGMEKGEWRAERTRSERREGIKTTDHIARLWAMDSIWQGAKWSADTIDPLPNTKRDNSLKLALAYRLVTPVSGAVVLETDQQYKDTGLITPSNTTKGIEIGQVRMMDRPVPSRRALRVDSLKSIQPMAMPESAGRKGSRLSDGRVGPGGSNAFSEVIARSRDKYRIGGLGTSAYIPGPQSIPTWIALFPLLITLLLQSRRTLRSRPWKWAAGFLCFYALGHAFLPAAWLLALGALSGILVIRCRQPGQRKVGWLLAFLFLSLPWSPVVVAGLYSAFTSSSYLLTGYSFDRWQSAGMLFGPWIMTLGAVTIGWLVPKGRLGVALSLAAICVTGLLIGAGPWY